MQISFSRLILRGEFQNLKVFEFLEPVTAILCDTMVSLVLILIMVKFPLSSPMTSNLPQLLIAVTSAAEAKHNVNIKSCSSSLNTATIEEMQTVMYPHDATPSK